MTEQLIPNPPLSDLPALPDDMRWRIGKGYLEGICRVHLERKVKKSPFGFTWERWVSIEWSTWRVSEGFGDLTEVNPEKWNLNEGLAQVVGYILSHQKNLSDPYIDPSEFYGVSKH